MTYLIKPRDGIYVKGYGILSFARKSTTNTIKTASKEQFKKQQRQLAILSIAKLLIKQQVFHGVALSKIAYKKL